MLLALDIGNTQTTAGVFDGETLVTSVRLHTEQRSTGDELGLLLSGLLRRRGVDPGAIDAVVVSNVVPTLSRAVADLSLRWFGCSPLIVGPGATAGLEIRYEEPAQVGADRIANAVAAQRLHGTPAILVDLGTATTLDVLDAPGHYLGGAIAPGIALGHEALVRHAARLTPVPLLPPPRLIGRTTAESVQAGLVLGHAAMIDGLVARMRQELEAPCRVIVTGGLAGLIGPLLAAVDAIDEQLTLTGLRLIHAARL